MAQLPGALLAMCETWIKLQALASAWLKPGGFTHLVSELADGSALIQW